MIISNITILDVLVMSKEANCLKSISKHQDNTISLLIRLPKDSCPNQFGISSNINKWLWF